MDKTLYFKASTNIKSLLGKGLVTDQIAAIFELVKNSYDADADCVKISFIGKGRIESLVISDNGSGMSLDDIKNKWMVVGTNSKKDKIYSPIYHRPLNGDKGIGRFSVDCLGAQLELQSVSRETGEKIDVSFDWNKFEDAYSDLDSIQIPYVISNEHNLSNGVVLEISELREEWSKDRIKELIRSLRQLKSPFVQEDNFSIIIDAPQMGYQDFAIEAEKLEDVSSLWIEVECKNSQTDIVYLTVNKDGLEYEETISNQYDIGPLKARVYFFNQGDKIRFKNRFSIRVKEFGNIRLYRDEFRIHPYGEPDNDWLDIDRRHAQGFSRTFSSRDLIGYVQTYKKENDGLIPLTNRQGLIENGDYKKLKIFIISYGISTLERYYFQKFKKNKDETVQNTSREIKDATRSLSQIAKEVSKVDAELAKNIEKHVGSIEKKHKEQLQHIKKQAELTEIYSKLSHQETVLQKIVHNALLDLKDGKTAIDELKHSSIFDEASCEKGLLESAIESVDASMKKLITVRDDFARVKEKERFILKQEIERTVNSFETEFNKYGIVKRVEYETAAQYYMDKNDLRSIMSNLISNSIKSLRQVNRENKEICIRLLEQPRFYLIVVKDNGVGISEFDREKIFTPFYSTTKEMGGFGIGLTIVDDILKEYNAHLELVDGEEPGATFIIKLKR